MYRLRPKLTIPFPVSITEGMEKINQELKKKLFEDNLKYVALETFPGVDTTSWIEWFQSNTDEVLVINADDLYINTDKISATIENDLTSDEVFGRFTGKQFTDLLDPDKLDAFHDKSNNYEHVIVIGVGASEVLETDLLVYLDIARWEIQLKHREGMKNWKSEKNTTVAQKLKRSYYFEWVAGDRLKDKVLPICDFYIDTNNESNPKMVTGIDMFAMLKEFTKQPFRLKPYFDSGVWGGKWMQETFNVDKEKVNLAWCFDGVPEENSIIMSSDDIEIEMPAYNLVTLYPVELLGEKVFGRYGRDYPIRFDFLDTIEGQNLSLQVHPTLDYAYANFGAKYTQDESYYIFESGDDAVVYLGVKENIDKNELVEALEKAKESGSFDDHKYIHQIPIKKHDHFLIPGGTVHSSGKNSVVLEISSTPNRFTFKLWDWGRLDLDGKPRPISLHHGKHVINTDFDEKFVNKELYNQFKVLEENDNYTEEKTGLHIREPIETRRLTIETEVEQNTEGSTNMLNLVDGEQIQILSVDNSFEPYIIYYGETFIIPENMKKYVIKSVSGKAVVLKAFIR